MDEARQRHILLRPLDWHPAVAAGAVFVVVLLAAGAVALVLVGAFTSSSGNNSSTVVEPPVDLSPRLEEVSNCLQRGGIGVGTTDLDFVAQTASGGAVKASVETNVVTISDGTGTAEAEALVRGYHRFAGDLPLAKILQRQGRFVLLWGVKPTRLQTAAVARCLR